MKKTLLLAFAAASFMFAQAATPELFFKNTDGSFKTLADGETVSVGYEEIDAGIYQWDSHLFVQADPEMEMTCKYKTDAQSQGAMMQVCSIDGQCVLGGADWGTKKGYIDNDDPTSMEVHIEYMDLMGTGAPTFETLSTIQVFYSDTPEDVLTVYVKTLPEEFAGISNVTIDNNAPSVYYNLQGVQVANPVQGNIYIVRQGNKAAKILF